MMRWLRRLLEAEAEVPRLPLEAGDAVTLTTLHGSKGLKWPVVVLPDLDRRVRARSDPVLCDPELGVSVDLGDDKERPMLHRLNSNRKAIAEEAELRRLLYVALTRAGVPTCEWRLEGGGGLRDFESADTVRQPYDEDTVLITEEEHEAKKKDLLNRM